jgi:hypothetical protein
MFRCSQEEYKMLKFATSHNLSGYVPPSYNKFRTTSLKKRKGLLVLNYVFNYESENL